MEKVANPTATTTRPGAGKNSLIRAGVAGTIGAILLGTATFLTAEAVSGPLVVTPPGQSKETDLNLAAIVLWIVLGGIAGVILAYLSRRFSKRPSAVFLAICISALVLYGIPAFTSSDETSTAIWLNITHIAVAIPIVGALYRALSTRLSGTCTT